MDEAFLESTWEQKVDNIRRFSVAIFVMGSDWVGKVGFLKAMCDIVVLRGAITVQA